MRALPSLGILGATVSLALATGPAAAREPVLEADAAVLQQAREIAGVVVESRTMRPIAGAQVVIDGTSNGTVTDVSGRFRLGNVPAGEFSLRVVMIGYSTVVQTVSAGATDVRIELSESAIALDEVIVTGTVGGQQRRAIGNSVSTVNVVDALEQSAARDVSSLLNGRAPGVTISQGSGRIGSGPTIQVRGRSTMSLDSEPIIYIDGVRMYNDVNSGPPAGGLAAQGARSASRLGDINPDDIESIEVIKGPAAATIYGTEAANGVIQIITKKGASGAARWTGRIEQGAVTFRNAADRIPTNFFLNEAGEVEGWNGVRQEEERGTPIYTTGHHQAYNLSVAGGQNLLRYYVSGTLNDTEGVEPNNYERRFSGHVNLDIAASEKLDISTSLHVVRSNTHLGTDVGISPLFTMLFGSPAFFPTSRGFYAMPPEVPQTLHDNIQDINRYTGGITFNHRPASWYSQRLVVGIDYTADDSRALERFAPPEMAPFTAAVGGPTAAFGRIAQALRNSTIFTGDYAGTFTFDLSPSINSATSFGAQFVRKDLRASTLGGTIFPAPGVETVSATAIKLDPTQTVLVNTTLGVYGQQQFGWNDRLFLTGALRIDNNSAFGEDFDFVVYPKVSASWVVSEEPFWNVGFVDALKLRAAYGQSGQQPDAFAALRTLTSAPRGNGTSGVTPQSFGNPDLKPERGTEIELGFETALFNRLSLDFTYFNKRTKDAIIERETAPSGGFPGNQFVNVGEISNRGVELAAVLQALTRDNLAIEIGGNIATNDDKVEDLGELPFLADGGLQRHAVGYPIGGFWARRVVSADRDPNTHAVSNILCDGGPGNDPVPCPQAPQVYLGRVTPSLTGAVFANITIANRVTLHGLVDFQDGHKRYNVADWGRCGAVIPVCEAIYRPEKYSTLYLAGISPVALSNAVEGAFIQDASFAKLREISATWRIPEQLLGRVGMSAASLTLAGRNLATWTSYGGLDPESRNPGAGGVDQAVTPQLTQFVATLNFSF